MKYVFGPVPSRRLGISLGVDLTPYKTCSFDCIYCQLGRTTDKTIERREYTPLNAIVAELGEFIESNHKIDYITLSGSGEPTLNSCLGELIEKIKTLTDIPVAVLTNSSLIPNAGVRSELSKADLIVPSLDVATQEAFERINRPCKGLRVRDIVRGLQEFRKGFSGDIWLEIMLVEGFNDNKRGLSELSNAIELAKPDRIQLNTVVRPPAEEYAKPLSVDRIHEIAEILNAEVITEFDRKTVGAYEMDKEEIISSMLKRRPCTLSDISGSLGLHKNEVLKYIEVMGGEGRVKTEFMEGKKYFRWVGNE